MAINTPIPTVNLASAAFKANPFPFYAQLRADAPVYRTTLPNKHPVWLITRYADVAAALKDERFAKDRHNALSAEQIRKTPWTPALFKALEKNMLDLDAPDHTRLRGLVHKVFTPRLVEHMRERVQQLADELLDKAAKQKHFDLIEGYALPIPMTIISEILGVPVQDRANFHRWTKGIISVSGPIQMLWSIPSFIGLLSYIRKLCQMRRADPQDDLISALVQASENGDRLNDEELQSMVAILLIAGHETTVNLIGNGTLALLENPDQFDLLRENPALIKTATEELLRYSPPVEAATERYAREDITINGVTIPRGEQMMAVLASANRDASQFEKPDVLDVTRENNKHLSFGQGIHYCVGAPLARLEGHIALNTLLARMPHLRLSVPAEKLKWRAGLSLRGLEALPVTV